MKRAQGHRLPAARIRALRPLLDDFLLSFDAASRIGFDPVEFPRRYADPADAEVVALLSASLAYGRADLFKPQIERILSAMGPSPSRFARSFARSPDVRAFAAFRYRFNQPEDVAALVAAMGSACAASGSLGGRFGELFALEQRGAEGALRRTLTTFARELREAPTAAGILAHRGGRGLLHLCPDPGRTGACKRWNLFLRWMVRGPDGVDLGIWSEVPRSALIIPLDTHVARIARCLGLTGRSDLSWRTAEEVTAGLRALDPDDPVRYDFALCHLGMSGACPSRSDPKKCRPCPLRPVCQGRAR